MLVTGATGGIGQAIARALAARGARLILTGPADRGLQALADELGARAVVCDLASREEVDRLGAEAVQAGIDVLVANAARPGQRAGDRAHARSRSTGCWTSTCARRSRSPARCCRG